MRSLRMDEAARNYRVAVDLYTRNTVQDKLGNVTMSHNVLTMIKKRVEVSLSLDPSGTVNYQLTLISAQKALDEQIERDEVRVGCYV